MQHYYIFSKLVKKGWRVLTGYTARQNVTPKTASPGQRKILMKTEEDSKAKVTVTKHIHKKETNQLHLLTPICKTASRALNCSFTHQDTNPRIEHTP